MPPELQAWLHRQALLEVMQVPGDGVAYIGFNMQDAATAKPQVREAIAHAIDRESIIRHVFGGAAQPAASVLLPSHWAGSAALSSPQFDPSRARALLAAAGYGATHPLKLVYKTSSDPFRIRLATILQSQLRDVGIDVALRSHDFGTFYGDIRAGRFQMYTLSWVGLKLPDIFRYAFHSESIPPGGANRGRLNDAALDAMIATAEAQTSPAAQAAGYRAVQDRLLTLLPIIPLWSEAVIAIARPRLRGYRPAADGSYDSLAASTW
jgi:peptide/nickel transport system substrate-binding protein